MFWVVVFSIILTAGSYRLAQSKTNSIDPRILLLSTFGVSLLLPAMMLGLGITFTSPSSIAEFIDVVSFYVFPLEIRNIPPCCFDPISMIRYELIFVGFRLDTISLPLSTEASIIGAISSMVLYWQNLGSIFGWFIGRRLSSISFRDTDNKPSNKNLELNIL